MAAGAADVLAASGIVFGFGQPLLDGVDLRVGAGTCVALLGANGAGKTTLLRIAGGLLTPESGRVVLDGRDATALDAGQRAARLGYLPQRTPRGHGFAVHEIVLMGLYPMLPSTGWESQREWLAVGRALSRLGARHLIRRPFDELSGGEQRRVLLARALVARPRLLLLDEPLAALDPGFAAELTGSLRSIKEEGVAMVVATHSLGLTRALADRVVMLREGHVLAAGTPASCLTAETLDATYGTEWFSHHPEALSAGLVP